MLLQSQTDEIQILPALPKAWPTGSVQGLRARGNFEITDLQWKNGKLSKLIIKSISGGECKLRTLNAVKAGQAGVKAISGDNDFKYRFKTVAGKSYIFSVN
ncbi:glycoside hydrolase family 95-like protein [Mucilaginibacter antarcticus]